MQRAKQYSERQPKIKMHFIDISSALEDLSAIPQGPTTKHNFVNLWLHSFAKKDTVKLIHIKELSQQKAVKWEH